jgi:archaemetzincin
MYLWWLGEGEARGRMMDHVRLHLERSFRADVSLWGPPALPAEVYDARRKQWSSSKLVAWISRSGPPAGKVLGVTSVDLFIPILTFVFGEAQLGGRSAVVSSARLAEPGLPDERVTMERLAKESVHEMGHVYGLLHCDVPGCVMGRSASVRDVDKKRGDLCASCRDRIARGGVEATAT